MKQHFSLADFFRSSASRLAGRRRLSSTILGGASLAFALVATNAAAQEATYAGVGQPWVSNRTIGEGAGIRTDHLEWHPGISGEFGYDSNFFQRAGTPAEDANFGPAIGSLRLRVIPQLSLRSIDVRRRMADDQRPLPPPPIGFEVKGNLAYNELIATDGQYSQQFSDMRNLEGAVSGILNVLPERPWSGSARANYSYIFEPSNIAGFASAFNRHVIGVGGNVRWRPGGGAFDWTLLDYGTRFTLFDQGAIGVYDNGNHFFSTMGRWNFLPKTALLFDGGVGILSYENPNLNSGEYLRARIGANGLLTKHLGLLMMGGWAASFFDNTNGLLRNYDDFIAKAEAKWYFNAGTRLQEGSANVGVSSAAIGYDRTFEQSYLSDFFQRDRMYGQVGYFFGGRVITTLDAGLSFINYPDFRFDGQILQGFEEKRLDITGFAEYRIIETVGINLTLRYDQNISQILTGPTLVDDLDFQRFRGFIGARWFL